MVLLHRKCCQLEKKDVASYAALSPKTVCNCLLPMEAGVVRWFGLQVSLDCVRVDGERGSTRRSSREFCVVEPVVRERSSRLLTDEGSGDLLCSWSGLTTLC